MPEIKRNQPDPTEIFIEPPEEILKRIETVYLPEIENIDANDTLALLKLSIPAVAKKTAEESIALGKRLEAGRSADGKLNEDATQARDELIFSCAWLNIGMARKYHGQNIPILDLIQEGWIGLDKATKKYDWRRGWAFNTYAYFWIFQAHQLAVSRDSGIPDSVYQRRNKVRKLLDAFTVSEGRDPNDEEIHKITGLKKDQLDDLRAAGNMSSPTRFSDLKRDREREDGLDDPEDAIEDSDALYGQGLEDRIEEKKVVKEKIAEIDAWISKISEFSENQAYVLKRRLGIDPKTGEWTGKVCSLQEIARDLGVTRVRTNQLQNLALHHIEDPGMHRFLSKILRSYKY